MGRIVYVIKEVTPAGKETYLGFNCSHYSALRSLERKTRDAVESEGGDPSRPVLFFGELPETTGVFRFYPDPKHRSSIKICRVSSGWVRSGYSIQECCRFELEKLEELCPPNADHQQPVRLAQSLILTNLADENDDESLLTKPVTLGEDADIHERLCNELQIVAYERRMRLRKRRNRSISE